MHGFDPWYHRQSIEEPKKMSIKIIPCTVFITIQKNASKRDLYRHGYGPDATLPKESKKPQNNTREWKRSSPHASEEYRYKLVSYPIGDSKSTVVAYVQQIK